AEFDLTFEAVPAPPNATVPALAASR
ncbi:MAG: hypothetical protein JWO85_2485, partial [Candidatus Eremiobacteraeota bacterium]|nr:hypothetical protein [Candidatus Eremiobacteraeota bacterium]